MIYIRIELWPYGNAEKRELLHEAFIANDGTGVDNGGNYDVAFSKRQGFRRRNVLKWGTQAQHTGRVEGFDRDDGVLRLVRLAFESVFGVSHESR